MSIVIVDNENTLTKVLVYYLLLHILYKLFRQLK